MATKNREVLRIRDERKDKREEKKETREDGRERRLEGYEKRKYGSICGCLGVAWRQLDAF